MQELLDVDQIVALQSELVNRWHREPVSHEYQGLLGTICTQHSFNYLLWHEEDIARSPDVGDAEIARVKRSIDGYNQQRNDWIEKVDDQLTVQIESAGITTPESAALNTETPGCAIDRLSIIALRIYHMQEQLDREDVSRDHLESVSHKLAVCRLQQHDLKNALAELLADIFAGRKQHRTYRQFKMYNDPTLNPYLYESSGDRKSA